MCGIAGYIGQIPNSYNCLETMVREIRHRGPDDRGIWKNDELGIFGLNWNHIVI